MARPARVRIRARKPCFFARRRLLGWKVRLLMRFSVCSITDLGQPEMSVTMVKGPLRAYVNLLKVRVIGQSRKPASETRPLSTELGDAATPDVARSYSGPRAIAAIVC